jgi:hypothetical protein
VCWFVELLAYRAGGNLHVDAGLLGKNLFSCRISSSASLARDSLLSMEILFVSHTEARAELLAFNSASTYTNPRINLEKIFLARRRRRARRRHTCWLPHEPPFFFALLDERRLSGERARVCSKHFMAFAVSSRGGKLSLAHQLSAGPNCGSTQESVWH